MVALFTTSERVEHDVLLDFVIRALRHRGVPVRVSTGRVPDDLSTVVFWGLDHARDEVQRLVLERSPGRVLPGLRPRIDEATRRWREAGVPCPPVWPLTRPDDLPDVPGPLAIYHGAEAHEVPDREAAESLWWLLRRRSSVPWLARGLPPSPRYTSVVVGDRVFPQHAKLGPWFGVMEPEPHPSDVDSARETAAYEAAAQEHAPVLVSAVRSLGLQWGVVDHSLTSDGPSIWVVRTTPRSYGSRDHRGSERYRQITGKTRAHWESVWLRVAVEVANTVISSLPEKL